MRHKILNDENQKTYALILDSGDEVMNSIMGFAEEHRLQASHFNAIGAFSRATLGYFDFDIKDYKKIEIEEQVEVLNITGDISLYKDQIKIHAHVVLSKKDGTAHGGHLIEGVVRPTLEVILTESPAYLLREYDEEIGLSLIKIDSPT